MAAGSAANVRHQSLIGVCQRAYASPCSLLSYAALPRGSARRLMFKLAMKNGNRIRGGFFTALNSTALRTSTLCEIRR
jgi:hypothetical protein